MDRKKIVGMILVAVAVLGGVFTFTIFSKKALAPAEVPKAVPQNKIGSPELPQKSQTEPPVSQPVEKSMTYENTEFGFKLKLPDGWDNYKIGVEKEPFQKGISYVLILLPTKEPNAVTENRTTGEKYTGYADMFSIAVWDKNVWNREISGECKTASHPGCPFEMEVLKKSDKYVFAAVLPNGFSPDDLREKQSQLVSSGVGYISTRFELIK